MRKSKKLIALTTVFFMFAGMFNTAWVSADASQSPVVTEYAINDFNNASEVQQFLYSDDTAWSVSNGGLQSSILDMSLQSIERTVNIPTGQNFAVELAVENLYSESDFIISLNGEESFKVSASGVENALDGNWIVYFDRFGGVKALKDGSEVTETGNPRITSSLATVDAISDVSIVFNANTEGVVFDYIYIYSFGETEVSESDYSNYSGSDYIVDRYNTRHDLVIADGKAALTVDQYTLTKDVDIAGTDDFIMEFKLSNSETYKKLRIKVNGETVVEYNAGSGYLTGDYKFVLNRKTSIATLYKNSSELSQTQLDIPGEITSLGVFTFGTTSKFDYFNVYTVNSTLDAQISDITTEGLKIISNEPIASAVVGSITSTISRINGTYFEYEVEFDSELNGDSDYTLEVESLFGNEANIDFSTPLSQGVLDALARLNAAKINPTVGEEDFATVVNEVAALFDIAAYKDNADIIEIAAGLRDEEGGFGDIHDVKRIFGMAEEILGERMILAAVARLNAAKINPTAGEEDFATVVNEVAEMFNITLYKNNAKVIEAAADIRDIQGGFADAADVRRVFEQAELEVLRKEGVFAKNDFNSESELQQFTFSNDANWTVSGGKLVSLTTDTSSQKIEKAVNIPAVQNFAIDLSVENLYSTSDLVVSFNDTECVKISASGSGQSLDGSWTIYYDRVDGVKVYKDGNEISAAGNPALTNSKVISGAVSKIGISFKGNSEGASFDSICIYGFGFGKVNSYESNYSDYSGSDYIVDKNGNVQELVIVDGKVPLTVDQYTLTKDIVTGDTDDIIIEFGISNTESYKRLQVKLGGSAIYESVQSSALLTGIYRLVLNRYDKSCEVYKDGTLITTIEDVSLPEDGISTAGVLLFGTTGKFDYFNVYTVDSAINAQISDVTTHSLTVSINVPIASAKAGTVSTTLQKEYGKYFEYDVTFNSALEEGSSYLLEVETFYGKKIKYEFETPTSQETKNALERLNASKLYPNEGEESFAAVVNEVADVFGISSYRDNANVIEIASYLRDEKGGFAYKTDVKMVFEQAEVLISKKNGDIEAFINYINNISAFAPEMLEAYSTNISPMAKIAVEEAVLASTFKNISDVKSKFANYVIIYGISFAENSEQVNSIISAFGGSLLNLTVEELSKHTSDIDKKLMGQVMASISDVAEKYRELINSAPEENAESFYYINNDFDGSSEIREFLLNATSGWTVDGGKLLCDTYKDNVTVNTIEKVVNIPETENFVLEFASEHIYRWSDVLVYLNDVEVVKINTSNAMFDGIATFSFDRTNGIKVYLNDSELTTETNPKITKNDMTGVGAVSNIKISFRGSHDKGEGICNFDYIKLYQLTGDAKIKNADNTEWDSIEIEFPPIIIEDTELKDYILIDNATVERVEKISETCYEVFFGGNITPNENHELKITDLPCEYGVTINRNLEFKTRDKKKEISMVILNLTDAESSNQKTKVMTKILNEFGGGESAVLVAAVYSADGEMLEIATSSVSLADGMEFFELNSAYTEDGTTIELYAVDGVGTFNRISSKNTYRVIDGKVYADSDEVMNPDNEGLKIEHKKDLVGNKIVVTAAKDSDKESEVTLALSVGYDDVAPAFDIANLHYIKNETLQSAENEIEILMPNDSKKYDLYSISKDGGVTKLATISMYSSTEIATGLNRLETAKVNPATGEESIKTVAQAVADIFDISEYVSNAEVVELAAALRDEQGGFADNNDVKAVFELADFIVSKSDGNVDNFIDEISEKAAINSDALQIFEDGKISSTAIESVKTSVGSAKFENLSDIKTKFESYVVLHGVNKATHYSQISNIIEKIGTSVIGLTAGEVANLKDNVAIGMLNQNYQSVEALKKAYQDLLKEKPSTPSGSGGAGGGGGGAVGGPNSYGVNSQPSTGNSQSASTTVFSDIGNVEWAKSAILSLAEKGIISGRGDGNFAPNDNCTRAEIARMICSALNLTLVASSNCTDVSVEDWSYPYVSAISSAGIMTGTDSNVFSPNMTVTREMMAVIICRAAQHINKAFPEATSDFDDISLASEYAKASIGALEKAGIVSGVDGVNFAPKKMCTRAEIAKIIDGFLQYIR